MTIPRSRVVDALFVLAVLVTGIGEIWVPFDSRQGEGNLAVATVEVVVAAAALWWRRIQPVRTLAVVLAAVFLPQLVAPGFLLFFGQLVPICIAVFSVARHVWRWSRGAAFAVAALFLAVELPFLGANLVKIVKGGWVPLSIAAVLVTVLTTWKRGRRLLVERTAAEARLFRVHSRTSRPLKKLPETTLSTPRRRAPLRQNSRHGRRRPRRPAWW